MFNRVKTLTVMQLKNKMNKRGINKLSTSISILIQVLVCVFVTIGLYVLLNYLKNLAILPIDTNFLLFLLFITQAISIITCIFGLSNVLYLSKDNSVIFSMPASFQEVFISKLAVFYITELKKNLFFLIPFFIAFAIVLNFQILFYIILIFMIFILPLFSVLIGAILSLPLMYFKKLIKKFPILKIILTLIITGLVIWFLVYLTNIIPKPLRIVAIYDQFFAFLKSFILSVNAFSIFYYNISNMMLGINFGINFLIFIAVLIGLLLLTFLISMLYFKIASQNFEHAFKQRRKQKNIPCKNTFFTFVRKELILNLRNTETFISHLLYVVSLPVLLYVVNQFISAIDINLNGLSIAFAVNILIGLLFLTATNTISASAITSEGAEFGLIKTAPSDTSKICYAKFSINFLISLIGIISSTIVLACTSMFDGLSMFIMFATFILVNTAHMFWSLQIDILNPKLIEYASSGNLRDSKNLGQCILIGVCIAIVIAVLAYFCFKGMIVINMLKLLLISGLFFLIRLYLFTINLKVYFKKIQM